MALWERCLVLFAITLWVKNVAYLLGGLLGLYLFGCSGLLLCLIPLAIDIAGASLIKKYYPVFLSDAESIAYRKAFDECEISDEDVHFTIRESRGSINHWMLRSLRNSTVCCLMAPKSDYVIIARKSCRVFPPASLANPFTYHCFDEGTLDVYYQDVNTVELQGGLITLTTSSARTISYTDHTDAANEAVDYLRQKVRSIKSSGG